MTEQTVAMDTPEAASTPWEPPAGSSGASPPPPPPKRSSWSQRPVARDPEHKMVSGVVAGVCRAYGFDTRSTRIALVIATLFVPVLLAVYVLAWIMLPTAPAEARPLRDVVTDRRRLPLMIVLGVVLGLAALGSLGSWYLFGGLPWGFGLIAIGVLLWLVSGTRTPSEPEPATSTPSGPQQWAPPPGTPQPEVVGDARPTALLTADMAPPAPAGSPPKRRAVPIGLWSIVAAGTALGVAAVGDGLDRWDVSTLTGVLLVLGMLTLGAGLSAAVNRRWSLVPLFVVLGGLTTLFAVTQPHLEGGTGERTVRPLTLAEAQEFHELGAGELTLDLRDLVVPEGQVIPVEVAVGLGRLEVILPPGAGLDATLSVGAGELVVDGNSLASGLRHDERWVEPVSQPGAPTVVLDAEVGMGELVVRHGR